MKNSNDTIGNRTRDLPTCRAVPQPTAPPRARIMFVRKHFFGVKITDPKTSSYEFTLAINRLQYDNNIKSYITQSVIHF